MVRRPAAPHPRPLPTRGRGAERPGPSDVSSRPSERERGRAGISIGLVTGVSAGWRSRIGPCGPSGMTRLEWGRAEFAARLCGTVEIEGSCGRLGDLHLIKNQATRRPHRCSYGLGPRTLHLLPRCCCLGLRAADSRHSHSRNPPAARRPCGRRGRGPPTRSRRRSVAGHRETPILPTSVGGPEPSHPHGKDGKPCNIS
jgi:hypothetical protein